MLLLLLLVFSVALLPALDEAPPSTKLPLSFKDLGRRAMVIDKLRLRSGPNISASTLGTLDRNTMVYLHSMGEPEVHDNVLAPWCYVETPTGSRDWCFGAYLQVGEWRNGKVSTKLLWSSTEGENAVLSPDGALLGLLGSGVNYEPAKVTIHNANTGIVMATHLRNGRITRPTAEFSQDSKLLYFTSDMELISLSTRTGELTYPITGYGGSEYFTSISRGVDGSLLLYSSDSSEPFSLWRRASATGEWHHDSRNLGRWTGACDLSPDGKYLVFASSNPPVLEKIQVEDRSSMWKVQGYYRHVVYGSKSLWAFSSDVLRQFDPNTGIVMREIALYLDSTKAMHLSYAVSEDRRVLALWQGSSWLYLYSLESGQLIRVLEFANREITSVSLNRNATMLALTFAPSSQSAIRTQVYSLDFQPNHNQVANVTEPRTWLVQNHFYKEGENWTLHFDNNGRYHLHEMYVGDVYGSYGFDGSTVVLYPPQRTTENSYAFDTQAVAFQKLGLGPGSRGLSLTVSLEWANLFHQGALVGNDQVLESGLASPAGRVYTYQGVRCIKYPESDQPGERFIAINEHLTMRESPSQKAKSVQLGWYDDEMSISGVRSVVFKDSYFHVIAATEKHETIKGISAPWYLIYEWDHSDGEYTDGGYVWVFGGYVSEFGMDLYPSFRERRDRNLLRNVRESGLVK